MIFVLRCQIVVDGRNLPIRDAVAAKFGGPELHRHVDRSEAVASKENSEWVGNNGGSCASAWRENSVLRIFSHQWGADDRWENSVAPAQSGLPPIKTSPV